MSSVNKDKPMYRHIIVRVQSVKNKEILLKATRKKRYIAYKRKTIDLLESYQQ